MYINEMNMNPLLRESILIIGAKRTMLQKAKESIDTLVVGSSHGDFGFNPTYFPNSFNLCCRSQDLKHSYYLYKNLVLNIRLNKSLPYGFGFII